MLRDSTEPRDYGKTDARLDERWVPTSNHL
jgi:hypothetical protein